MYEMGRFLVTERSGRLFGGEKRFGYICKHCGALRTDVAMSLRDLDKEYEKHECDKEEGADE